MVGPDGLRLGVAGARLLLAELRAGRLVLPDAPRLHVFVASGAMRLGDHALEPGDTARLTDQGGRVLEVEQPGSVAVWAFDAAAS